MTTPRARRSARRAQPPSDRGGAGERLSTQGTTLGAPFFIVLVPIVDPARMTLVMPMEIPVTTNASLGIRRLALPRASFAEGTVPLGRGDLFSAASGARNFARTRFELACGLRGVRRTGSALLPRRGAVVVPRPIRDIRRRGSPRGHGSRLLNVSRSAARVPAEHKVVLLKNRAPCVVRVANLNLDIATRDGQDPLGLLNHPFRNGDAAVRLGKRFRPPGSIKLVWIAASHAVPPECGDSLGVDDDALAPRVRSGLERFALVPEVGVRLVAPGHKVEPCGGARIALLVIQPSGASIFLLPLMGLVTMLRARVRPPSAHPENDPSDISRRLGGIVLI